LFGITLDFNKKEVYKDKITYRDYVVASYTLLNGKAVSKYFNLVNFKNLEEAVCFAKEYLDNELAVLKSNGVVLYSERHLGR
jgi:hypothetical protein